MKRTKEQGITLVALVVTIIILIILAGVSVNTLLGENGLIEIAKRAKENYILASEEEEQSINQLTYILETGEGIPDEDKPKDELLEELTALKELLNRTTATEDKIVKNYIAYSKGQLMTGTMEDNGAVNSSINCGESYTIPAGYHNGSGIVTGNSLESQTQATATADNLSEGVTAWVNGQKITGNGADVKNALDDVTGALFGGTTQNVEIACSTSTNSSVSVHSNGDPLWTEKVASNVGKSDPIYLLKDPNGNAAIANTITISYSCGGSQAYGQEFGYAQTIYLKDEAGNILDTITNGNSSKTWNLFTLPISGSYVYIDYSLYARVRYTTSNANGQARAYASMTTPSVVYLYAE